MRLELASPGLQTKCYTAQKLLLGRSWVYPICVFHHYIFIVSQLWLLLIAEVLWFFWTHKPLIQVEKFTMRMPKVWLKLATPGLHKQCCTNWHIELKSYCWELVEFIQLVYCIIIYISFLNCDGLLIGEVQLFYWTQKLLVPVEKFIERVPKVRLELASNELQTQCSSDWAIQLKKLLGCSWVYLVVVLHHYIFIISQLWFTCHPICTLVLLDTETPGTSRETYSEDDEGEILTCNN